MCHTTVCRSAAHTAPAAGPTSSTPACVLPPLLAATSKRLTPFLLASWCVRLAPADAGSTSLSAARRMPRAAAAAMSAGAAASCRYRETPLFSSSSCCRRSSSCAHTAHGVWGGVKRGLGWGEIGGHFGGGARSNPKLCLLLQHQHNTQPKPEPIPGTAQKQQVFHPVPSTKEATWQRKQCNRGSPLPPLLLPAGAAACPPLHVLPAAAADVQRGPSPLHAAAAPALPSPPAPLQAC
jgi:hypothetical protein